MFFPVTPHARRLLLLLVAFAILTSALVLVYGNLLRTMVVAFVDGMVVAGLFAEFDR